MQDTMHRQVKTSRGILVDEGIAGLIEALWALGVETLFSCENCGDGTDDYRDWAYIYFADRWDAWWFQDEVAGSEYRPAPRGGACVDFPSAWIGEIEAELRLTDTERTA